MLKTNNPVYKIILIFSLVLIAAGIAVSVYSVFAPDATTWIRISGGFTFVTLLFAVHYIVKGYSKDAAKYYKVYTAAFALCQIISIIGISTSAENAIAVLYPAIIFGFLILLMVTKDLGKKNSAIICGMIIFFSALALATGIYGCPGITLGGTMYGTLVLGRNAIQMLLGCLLGVMTFAKYSDKAERGTK